MISLYDVINNRASCRNFSDKGISDNVINKILNAACKAPSSGGFQKYSIIKVTKEETKHNLAKLCRGQSFIEKAPINIVFCIDYRRIKRINEVIPAPCDLTNSFMEFFMAIIDTAICAHTLCLAAEEEGLSSVYIGNIINTIDQVSDLLHLPQYVCPSIMVVLGYPKNKPKMSEKYNADVIVHDEEYKDMDIDDLVKQYENRYRNWNMKITDNIINKIYETCYKLNGKEFADECRNYIINEGIISSYQFWFGYYYLQQEEFLNLEGYINFMKKQGFNWIG